MVCSRMRFNFLAFNLLAGLTSASTSNEPYKVIFHLDNLESGSSGDVVVEVHPEWAPLAAQRFAELVEQRFFDDNRFFRVVCGFVAQFGISGDPKISSAWHGKELKDEPQLSHITNGQGRLSFFTDGKDDRNTQIVFNVKDNMFLDDKGYVPFAEVKEGQFFIDRIYNGYGGSSKAPVSSRMETEGNAYVDKDFPRLTRIRTVEVVQQPSAVASAKPHVASGVTASPLYVALGVFLATAIFGSGWLLHIGGFSGKASAVEP